MYLITQTDRLCVSRQNFRNPQKVTTIIRFHLQSQVGVFMMVFSGVIRRANHVLIGIHCRKRGRLEATDLGDDI